MLKKLTKGILIPFFILLVQSLMAADNIDSLMKVHDYAPGTTTKSSPLVKAKYPEDLVGQACSVDLSCEIGKDCIGLKIVR